MAEASRAMAPSPLAGLRGALAGLHTPLLLLATLRVLTRFAFWLTGVNKRVPRFVQQVGMAARFAAVASGTVALGAATMADDWKLLAEFEVCAPSTSQRATGLVAMGLLFLYGASSSFSVVCSTVLGLRLIANGNTATAFLAGNVAIGDDASSLPGLFAILISGFFYAYMVNVLQERQKMCDERDAGILAAVAWMAGVVHMISALWKMWRGE